MAKLYATQQLTTLLSDNGIFRVVFQEDGNLVLLDNLNKEFWSSKSQGKGGRTCIMQQDGNLVIYDVNHNIVWSSPPPSFTGSTVPPGNYYLSMQDDGNLVIYLTPMPKADMSMWSTGTTTL